MIRPTGSTPTIQCRHCGTNGSLPNSAMSDIAARGAGLPGAGTGILLHHLSLETPDGGLETREMVSEEGRRRNPTGGSSPGESAAGCH